MSCKFLEFSYIEYSTKRLYLLLKCFCKYTHSEFEANNVFLRYFDHVFYQEGLF